MTLTTTPGVALTIVMLLSAGLGACTDSNQTAGQKVDAAVATTERKADAVKADIRATAAEMKSAVDDAATTTRKVISDAAITTSVNAELAKDNTLSALKINVDSKGGRVALVGSAPDLSSKERATSLAAGVEGVKSVDNQLTVR
jgi:hyperosmotically inducible periplasmic protein